MGRRGNTTGTHIVPYASFEFGGLENAPVALSTLVYLARKLTWGGLNVVQKECAVVDHAEAHLGPDVAHDAPLQGLPRFDIPELYDEGMGPSADEGAVGTVWGDELGNHDGVVCDGAEAPAPPFGGRQGRGVERECLRSEMVRLRVSE